MSRKAHITRELSAGLRILEGQTFHLQPGEDIYSSYFPDRAALGPTVRTQASFNDESTTEPRRNSMHRTRPQAALPHSRAATSVEDRAPLQHGSDESASSNIGSPNAFAKYRKSQSLMNVPLAQRQRRAAGGSGRTSVVSQSSVASTKSSMSFWRSFASILAIKPGATPLDIGK